MSSTQTLLASSDGARLDEGTLAESEKLVGLDRVLKDLEASAKPDAKALVAALLAAGSRGVRELFAELHDKSNRLDDSERRTLQSALDALPRFVLDGRADPAKSSKRVEQEIKIALQAISEFGVAEDFSIAVRLVLPEDPLERTDSRLTGLAEGGLAALMRRNPKVLAEIPQLYRALDPRAKPLVLRSIGSVAEEASLDFLSSQLGSDKTLDLIVLGQIGRVASLLGSAVNQSTRTYVLMSLVSPDPAYRREACLTLGRLEETEAVPDLIELLSDPDTGVARNAHWALERTTRKKLEPKPERWRTWLAKEQNWWATEAADAFRALRSQNPGEVSAAIRKLASHRLHRHEAASELLFILDGDNDSLVEQACGALFELGSRPTRSRLTPLLQHASAGVRMRAKQALDVLAVQP